MRIAVAADIHGADIEPLIDFLAEEQPDLFIEAGDFIPKGGSLSGIESAVTDQKRLERKIVDQEIGFVRVPGNYDHKAFRQMRDLTGTRADESEFISVVQDPSDFRYSGLEHFESPTEHSFGFEADNYRVLVVHAGLDGETPYAEDIDPKELDMNVNFYDEQGFLPESFRANFEAMERENIDLLIRGHEEDTGYYQEDGRYIVTAGPYREGDVMILDTGAEPPEVYRETLELSGENPWALFLNQ